MITADAVVENVTDKFYDTFKNMILFEDQNLIAINKPNQLAVQSGTKVKLCVDVLITAYSIKMAEILLKPIQKLRIVHRLDKETSGILLIAKTLDSARKLTTGFADKVIEKNYHAILQFDNKSSATRLQPYGRIENKLTKHKISNEDMVVIAHNGKEAITEYEIEKKLKELPIEIYRGVLTGYNDAFYIDEEKKNELIAKDAKSAEVIVPLLRGKDVDAFFTSPSGIYMIGTFPALHLDIDDYPSVKDHLLSFGKERLEQSGAKGSRKKTRNLWFETQDSIAYHESFARPKIVYPNMTSKFPFCYDDSGVATNQKCFIMTGDGDTQFLKALTAILNSKLAKLWIWYTCPELIGGTRELSKVYFEKFPVCPIPSERQQTLAAYVDRIIAEKRADAQADTSSLEAELDKLVYQLYGLTEEEYGFVEQGVYQAEETQPEERNKKRGRKKAESTPKKRKTAEDDEWLD